jgi:hypothetical protein
MSYLSTVLSKNPVFFFRCDDPTGSTVMVDASPNGYNGTYFSGAGFGFNSPIETDAASKAISGAVGVLTIADGPDSDVRDNFTLLGWGYNSSGLLAGTGTILCRAGQFGVGGVCAMGFNGTNTAYVEMRVGATNYSLSYAVNADTYYFFAVTRNGNVLRLYINGVLRAERTDLGAGDIDIGSSDGWYIGRSQSSNTWAGAGTDEVAVCPTALSAADILAIDEAARAILPLRATIIINLGIELNTDQIEPVDLGFPHNFSATFGDQNIPIVEELEYKTNINQSEPDYQQRVSARPHGPLRTLEYHLSPTSGAARARLQGSLWAPGQFYCVPVWSDYGVLTGTATSGTNTLALDTTKRDYEVGSYVGICSDLQNPGSYQFFKITAVADAQLTLDENIATTVASGSPVFPARVASLSDDNFAVKSFAADHEYAMFRFELIESELSTRRITAYTPSTTYLSTEVFTLETAKVSFLDDRPYEIGRRIQTRGRDYQFAIDTGSPQTFPVRFLLTSRSALSDFYGWLDARQGKLNPLFVSTKERDLIPSAGNGTSITVAKTGFSLHHGRRHLEFLKTDGSFTRARVTAITDNGNGTETWSVTSPAFADISKVSFLKYCTLAADTIRIQHWKGNVSECGLSFRELLTSPS